jgi:hypothetical protein
MRARHGHGKGDIRCQTVPDPKVEDDRDATIKIITRAICPPEMNCGSQSNRIARWNTLSSFTASRMMAQDANRSARSTEVTVRLGGDVR